jgi:hypothetical protein
MYGVVYNNWRQGMVAWGSIVVIGITGWYVTTTASKVFAMDNAINESAMIISSLRCDDGNVLEVTYQHNVAIVDFSIPHNARAVLTKREPSPPWLEYSLKDSSTVLLRGPEYTTVRENGQATYDHCVAND